MTILITAGTSGLGLEIYRQLKTEAPLDLIIRTTSSKNKINENDDVYYLNLSEIDSIKIFTDKMKERQIVFSNIYHCAHQFSKTDLFLNISSHEFSQSLQTNVVGTFELLKTQCRPMTRKKFGRILIIGSYSIKNPSPGKIIYITEKSAIEAMAMTFNKELSEKNIQLFVLHPGLINSSDIKSRLADDVIKKIGEENLLSEIEVAKKAIDILQEKIPNDFIINMPGNQKW